MISSGMQQKGFAFNVQPTRSSDWILLTWWNTRPIQGPMNLVGDFQFVGARFLHAGHDLDRARAGDVVPKENLRTGGMDRFRLMVLSTATGGTPKGEVFDFWLTSIANSWRHRI